MAQRGKLLGLQARNVGAVSPFDPIHLELLLASNR